MIQSTQNKDAKAVHLKLDELIHVISKARNRLIDCEDLSDEELAELDAEFQRLRDDPDCEVESVESVLASRQAEAQPRT
jgi:low affinity Fe/Cu permease